MWPLHSHPASSFPLATNVRVRSVGQGQGHEGRIQRAVGELALDELQTLGSEGERLLRVHVLEAISGRERGPADGDDHVLVEERAVPEPEAVVNPDVVTDSRLEE